MTADKLTPFQWEQIKFFVPKEFMGSRIEGDPRTSMLPWLDERVLWALARLRRQCGLRMTPSWASGAIARTWKPESQHYTIGRISTAVDLFVLEGTLKDVYEAAELLPEIGGFGAYPQWKPYHGVHIDIRPRNGRLHTWMAKKEHDEQIYLGLDWELVRKLTTLGRHPYHGLSPKLVAALTAQPSAHNTPRS